MKKKMIFAATVLAVVAIVSCHKGFSSLEKSKTNPLILANIEALSNDEYNYSKGKEHTFECGAYLGSNWLSGSKKCSFVVITCPAGGEGCNPRPCKDHG